MDDPHRQVVADYVSCCNRCMCSMPRSSDYEVMKRRSKPFYCLHPLVAPRKVTRDDKPFTQRPEWCPLETADVIVKPAPPGWVDKD